MFKFTDLNRIPITRPENVQLFNNDMINCYINTNVAFVHKCHIRWLIGKSEDEYVSAQAIATQYYKARMILVVDSRKNEMYILLDDYRLRCLAIQYGDKTITNTRDLELPLDVYLIDTFIVGFKHSTNVYAITKHNTKAAHRVIDGTFSLITESIILMDKRTVLIRNGGASRAEFIHSNSQ